MTMISRAEWGARAPRTGPGALDPARVEGVALHWPGWEAGHVPGHRGVSAVAALIRGWQAFHMDSRGWSDIAYQEAIDQDGNVYDLRGLATQSGANGDQDVNERFGAILLVLGPGEQPSAAMITATRGRVQAFRALFPGARKVVGHATIRPEPTQCPGEVVIGLLVQGAFDPPARSTRGENIDAALRRLRKADTTGARGRFIARAIQALERITPWKAS